MELFPTSTIHGESVVPMRIGLIHTSDVLVPLFQQLCNELLPNVETVNISDDSLIKETMAIGRLTDSVSMWLQGHIRNAQQAGVDAIMVTCSSLGPAVEASAEYARVPLIRVDRAMADAAVALASRIGVIATVATTLRPTVELIERCAMAVGKPVQISTRLCDGALEMLLAGNLDQHDQLVMEKLVDLASTVDVVVLAQASMTRIISSLPENACKIPILSSPRLAIESLAKQIQKSV